MNLAGPLSQHVKSGRLGVVCGAGTGFVLATDPDTVLAPDIAFVRRTRIPPAGRPRTFWNGAPDLAVEVVSPGDTRTDVTDKVTAWLSYGTLAVWVVDPADMSVTIAGRLDASTRPTRWTVLRRFPGSACRSPRSSRCRRQPEHRRRPYVVVQRRAIPFVD